MLPLPPPPVNMILHPVCGDCTYGDACSRQYTRPWMKRSPWWNFEKYRVEEYYTERINNNNYRHANTIRIKFNNWFEDSNTLSKNIVYLQNFLIIFHVYIIKFLQSIKTYLSLYLKKIIIFNVPGITSASQSSY